MTKIALILISLLVSNFVQASDSATCVVILNGQQVDEVSVYHQDYDVNLNGEYNYRTYKKDEFYKLSYNFMTRSDERDAKLKANLVGNEHTFSADTFVTATKASVTIVDHEDNQLIISCKID